MTAVAATPSNWPAPPVAPDAALARRAASGDESSLGELLARHGTTLYAIAYGILLDAASAERVVSLVLAEFARRVRGAGVPAMPVHRWLAVATKVRAQAAQPGYSPLRVRR